MKRLFLTVQLLLVLSLISPAQTRPAPSSKVVGGIAETDSSAELRMQTFDIVWRTVKVKHFDPSFGGVDWDKVREEYAPRAGAAKSNRELYGLLQQMLDELHQSHFSIVPPESVVPDDVHEPPNGGVGIRLKYVDGMALITRVEPRSSAARAGLRAGFVVKQVDQTTVQETVKRFAKSRESEAVTRIRILRAIVTLIGGTPGSSVRLGYLDGRDRPREVTVRREKLKGEMSPRFGNFPPQYTEFEAGRLEGGIGYIRFNVFVQAVMERIRASIRSMSDAPGLIIDLRGNPGGLGGMSNGMAGLLNSKEGSLGTMRYRSGYNNFAFFPQKDPYTGPVVILIDEGSASTSEVFAAGMQELERAVVVGQRSAGAALPSLFEKLPTGALFQYAIADFRTPKGTLVEGRGVIPDFEVKLTRGALLEGRDPQLEAAAEQIKKSVERNRRRPAA